MTNLSPQIIESKQLSSAYFHRIVSELCHKNGLVVTSHDEGNILELTSDTDRHFIWRRKFDLNSGPSMRLADNKYECGLIQKSKGVPMLEYSKVNTEYKLGKYYIDESSYEIIRNFLSHYGKIVLKPNAGYGGEDVFLCADYSEIINAIDNMSFPHKYLVISPYLPIRYEYRIIVLDGCGILVYRKSLPYVVGDGHSTVAELMHQSNLNPDMIAPSKSHKRIAAQNESIPLGWQHNLAKGARSDIVTDTELSQRLTELATLAANNIGIRFASVDISEFESGQLVVIEINSGVVLENFISEKPERYAIAYQVYDRAIHSMFNLV